MTGAKGRARPRDAVPPMKDLALLFAHQANEMCGGQDPRFPFVVLMTAAAVAGHMMERPAEEMHRVLDQVMPVALAAMLEATETKQ